MRGQRFALACLLAGAVLGSAVVAAADSPAVEQANWQHVKAKFNYFGFTSHYTCHGIEGKVGQILELFGARKDPKVVATGCERGPGHPSASAWVEVEFDAPAAGAGATPAETFAAHWAKLEVAPNRPFEMGAGDCELLEQMRDVLTKHFATKDLAYETHCVPHQTSLGAYSIKGQVLKASPPAKVS
ncbi:MAG: hypothetical protein IT480_03890 [Gammaproteobacteria bacterium]|nr:hypothetical protein [Gammaproteobacteria bacterium]